MRIIAVVADKGGVGKSTLSIHLGVEASRRDLTAVILGCDPQACTEVWSDIRNQGREEKLPPGVLTTQAARIPHIIENARSNGVDFMVIDIGANSENGASYAVRAADFVVIPTSPRLWDINGVPDIARKAKEYNKPYCILINRVLRGPYRAEAERVLEAWNYPICPIALHERVAFANCITSGNAAMEVEPDSTASREFISFYDWLDQQTSAQASPDPGIPQQEVTVG